MREIFLETTILVVYRGVAIGEIYMYVECRPSAMGWATLKIKSTTNWCRIFFSVITERRLYRVHIVYYYDTWWMYALADFMFQMSNKHCGVYGIYL